MIYSSIFCLFGIVFTNVVAEPLPIRRREENATTDHNTFASITPSKTLAWVSCYGDSLAAELGPVSCARLIAPLDYLNTSFGDVQLAIIKLGASNHTQTTRTVFVNPGGPGDDPIEFITDHGALLRAQVGNDVDLVGIVPRGVGSTFPPITCDATDLASAQRNRDITNSQPGYTDKSLNESYAVGKSLELDCDLVTPSLIPYVGTVHVAKDMDYVLQILGQDKLSYLGYSYGSILGATYAALFPDKIDRMLLDGIVDFNTWYKPEKEPELHIGDADTALNNFFQFCYDAGPDKCAFWYSSPKEIRDRFFEADQRLLENPLPIPGFGLLKVPLWRSGVYSALYQPARSFALLASVAAEIYDRAPGRGIKSYLESVNNASSPIEPPLVDTTTGLKNSPIIAYTIGCSDSGGRAEGIGMSKLEAVLNRHQGVSQYFGGLSSQIEIICLSAGLPAKERFTDKFENIRTSSPILFVGNTADPTTPLRNAFSMSKAFPGSSVLTINGTGHMSYSATQDSECAAEWIMPYFRNGTLPPNGTVCEGKQTPFELPTTQL
ncbi:hypothetical protein GJ744_002735 [Endocarpon pusillum]|uniref:Peptidase S33 tripeptidyl aminopeptidase-like C-terminal domain-containing protein n=1 Tax=Endocarpon pusillum TaxID=364733 RepID=A0A8H7E7D4_9EURO|nr:hypothetical protein GJ744_002735 [Endocarpon pusillum]